MNPSGANLSEQVRQAIVHAAQLVGDAVGEEQLTQVDVLRGQLADRGKQARVLRPVAEPVLRQVKDLVQLARRESRLPPWQE